MEVKLWSWEGWLVQEARSSFSGSVHCAHWALCTVHTVDCAHCALCTLYTGHCAVCTLCTVHHFHKFHTTLQPFKTSGQVTRWLDINALWGSRIQRHRQSLNLKVYWQQILSWTFSVSGIQVRFYLEMLYAIWWKYSLIGGWKLVWDFLVTFSWSFPAWLFPFDISILKVSWWREKRIKDGEFLISWIRALCGDKERDRAELISFKLIALGRRQ